MQIIRNLKKPETIFKFKILYFYLLLTKCLSLFNEYYLTNIIWKVLESLLTKEHVIA